MVSAKGVQFSATRLSTMLFIVVRRALSMLSIRISTRPPSGAEPLLKVIKPKRTLVLESIRLFTAALATVKRVCVTKRAELCQ